MQEKSVNTGKEGQDKPKMTSQAIAPVFCTGGYVSVRRSHRTLWNLHHPGDLVEPFWASVHRPVAQTWWPPTYLELVFQSLREGWKRDLWRNPWEKSILRMKEEDGEGDWAVREDVELWRTENFWKSMANSKHQMPSCVLKGIVHLPSVINFSVICVCVHTQLCQILHDPMDSSPPGSSVHGIFQARILQWVAISFSRGSSQARDWTHISWVSYTGR